MKIEIEGLKVFDSRYERWDDLVDDYARDEAKHGRVVPPYALEFLMGAIALWVLEKAANKVVDWVLEHRAQQREEQERREQIERLRNLDRALAEMRSQTAQTAAGQEAILRALREVQARLIVTQETEVDRDLARALEDKLHGIPTVVIRSNKNTN